jgi:hypothetical protein
VSAWRRRPRHDEGKMFLRESERRGSASESVLARCGDEEVGSGASSARVSSDESGEGDGCCFRLSLGEAGESGGEAGLCWQAERLQP